MKTAIAIVAILVITLGNGPVLADAFTFAVSSGDWNVPTNWSPNYRFPVDADTATVPSGKTCRIFTTGEACDWFDVQTGGELQISKGGTLTIDQDSTVDGTLSIGIGIGGYTEKLLIRKHVTIEGNGGKIVMYPTSEIDDNGSFAWILTIQSSSGGFCHAGSCSVVVRGRRWGHQGDPHQRRVHHPGWYR